MYICLVEGDKIRCANDKCIGYRMTNVVVTTIHFDYSVIQMVIVM